MSSIIYLHGFGGVGNSVKSQELAKVSGSHVFAPTLPINPAETIKIVSDIVASATSYPIVFVGTSLGGFWATYFSQKFDCPCIAVNPSTSPTNTMSERIGKLITNYATGEPIVITAEDVLQYRKCEDEILANLNGANLNLFLAEDDDVLDYMHSIQHYDYFNSRVVTKDGGHGYIQHWDNVVACAGVLANG